MFLSAMEKDSAGPELTGVFSKGDKKSELNGLFTNAGLQ